MQKELPPLKALVVDDEPVNISVIDSILKADGWQVVVATSGADCLRQAAAAQPDVILMDVQMPGMDGYEATAALRQEEATRSIPVIMVTALKGKEDRVLALRAGAIDFLTKPVDPDELRAKVKAHARIKGYHDEMRRRQEELSETVARQGGQLQGALEAFARFVPQEFLRTLGRADITTLKLGDHVKLKLAILFSDIRGFTSLSEKMTPEENFAFLNSYLGRMNPFVWENGGFIDKYIGDSIMALFPDGAAAVSAAVAMLAHLPVYNAQRAAFGYAPVRVGIGVHAGPVMLGVIGHDRFMQGTAISDAVNLASRLQELTKVYGVSMVISSQVLFDMEDPNRIGCRFLDKLRIRGKEEAVSVYEVFEGDAPDSKRRKQDTRAQFEKGVYAFHAGQFTEAAARFAELPVAEVPDAPVEIYRARCARALKLGMADEPLRS